MPPPSNATTPISARVPRAHVPANITPTVASASPLPPSPAAPAPASPDVLAQHPVASVIIAVLMIAVVLAIVGLGVWLLVRAVRKRRAHAAASAPGTTTFTIVQDGDAAAAADTVAAAAAVNDAKPSRAAASPQQDRLARVATIATVCGSILVAWALSRVLHLSGRATTILLAPLVLATIAGFILLRRAKTAAGGTEGFVELLARVRADKAGQRAALFVCTYALGSIVSWTYRLEAGSILEGVAFALLILLLAFVKMPLLSMLVLVGGVVVLAAQVYFVEIYWMGYRKVFCKYFPDFVLQAPGSSVKHRKGRVWKRTPLKDGGEEILFSVRKGGVFQWWKGLQSLHITAEQSRAIREKRGIFGPTLTIFSASDLAYDEATRDWSLTSDGFQTQPLSENGAIQIMRNLTQDNAEVAKHGLEGNPFHLAFKSEGAGASTSRINEWDLEGDNQ